MNNPSITSIKYSLLTFYISPNFIQEFKTLHKPHSSILTISSLYHLLLYSQSNTNNTNQNNANSNHSKQPSPFRKIQQLFKQNSFYQSIETIIQNIDNQIILINQHHFNNQLNILKEFNTEFHPESVYIKLYNLLKLILQYSQFKTHFFANEISIIYQDQNQQNYIDQMLNIVKENINQLFNDKVDFYSIEEISKNNQLFDICLTFCEINQSILKQHKIKYAFNPFTTLNYFLKHLTPQIYIQNLIDILKNESSYQLSPSLFQYFYSSEINQDIQIWQIKKIQNINQAIINILATFNGFPHQEQVENKKIQFQQQKEENQNLNNFIQTEQSEEQQHKEDLPIQVKQDFYKENDIPQNDIINDITSNQHQADKNIGFITKSYESSVDNINNFNKFQSSSCSNNQEQLGMGEKHLIGLFQKMEQIVENVISGSYQELQNLNQPPQFLLTICQIFCHLNLNFINQQPLLRKRNSDFKKVLEILKLNKLKELIQYFPNCIHIPIEGLNKQKLESYQSIIQTQQSCKIYFNENNIICILIAETILMIQILLSLKINQGNPKQIDKTPIFSVSKSPQRINSGTDKKKSPSPMRCSARIKSEQIEKALLESFTNHQEQEWIKLLSSMKIQGRVIKICEILCLLNQQFLNENKIESKSYQLRILELLKGKKLVDCLKQFIDSIGLKIEQERVKFLIGQLKRVNLEKEEMSLLQLGKYQLEYLLLRQERVSSFTYSSD